MADQSIQDLHSVDSIHRQITLFSSVGGGFSRSIGKDAFSLRHLIEMVQDLRLNFFHSSEMSGSRVTGEGSSYQVFRCYHKVARVVAVKEIKLPSGESQQDEFRRRVCCVLKDLEVMHHPPLARHGNVIRLLGYGYGSSSANPLPFLVTEYSQYGTLREYLVSERTSLVARLKLCGGVASGLHAMHLSGVAHGDVKLENVLIFVNELEDGEKPEVVPKLSDFGHACLVSSEQSYGSIQSYRGTTGYIAPEIYSDQSLTIDFLRCDIWALALLVWETLAGGSRYMDDPKVQALIIDNSPKPSHSPGRVAEDAKAEQGSPNQPGYEFAMISAHLSPIAVDFVDEQLKWELSGISQLSRDMVKWIFRSSLQVDPAKRCSSISKLPFTYSNFKSIPTAIVPNELVEKAVGKFTWDFKLFTPQSMTAIPHATKAQMLSDVERRLIEEPSRLESEDESLLYLAFAHGAGFGVSPDQREFHSWTTASGGSGSATASLILKVLDNSSLRHETMLEAFGESLKHSRDRLCSRVCLSTSQDAESRLVTSFTSADNCNPLHFLSFFSRLSDEPWHPDSFDGGLRRWDLALRSRAPIPVLRRTDFRELSEPLSQVLERDMQNIVRHFGPKCIFEATPEPHYLHNHYPLSLIGTPLSFAVMLNCVEAIRALLNEGAHPLDILSSRTSEPPQDHSSDYTPLHAAISCHQKKTFVLLWSNCLARGLGRQMYEDYVHPGHHGAALVSALAHKSVLERTLLHCTNRLTAQTDMIGVLIESLSSLSSAHVESTKRRTWFRKLNETNISPKQLLHAVIFRGVERIIALGNLDIATEILSSKALQFATTPASILMIFEESLRMAVSGIVDPAQSLGFLRFARGLGLGPSADLKALSTIMRWKRLALFYGCLNENVRVNARDEDGQSLLHYMITTGFYEVAPVSTLLQRGAIVDCADRQGLTPLQLAVKRGLFDLIKQLLNAGANPMIADHKGVSTLRYAVVSRNVSVVTEILQALKQSTDRDSKVSCDLYTLHGDVRARHGKLDIDYGTVDGRIPEDGKTVLHISVKNHDLEITNLLLAHGVNVHRVDSEGNEALNYAIKSTESNVALSLCQSLLDAGADTMARNSAGETPLHQAIQLNGVNLELLECFIKRQGFDTNTRGPGGQTLLHLSAGKGADVLVASLLEHGASASLEDSQGRTALHACAEAAAGATVVGKMPPRVQRMLTVVDILLHAASNPFARDINGYTPLEYAAINGHSNLLCHLVRSILNYSTEDNHAIYREELREALSSAWSLSIEKEQWLSVTTLLLYPFDFERNMSLLRWPVGAHFFKYSISATHWGLKSNHFAIPKRIALCSAVPLHSNYRGLPIYGSDLSIPILIPDKLPVELRLRKDFVSWDDLPQRLRPGIDSKFGIYQWNPNDCRVWEDIVDPKEIHNGGDPLVEIFDFIAKWELYILKKYFGTPWQKAGVYFHADLEEAKAILNMSASSMEKHQLQHPY